MASASFVRGLVLGLALAAVSANAGLAAGSVRPDVILITVDTLRYDRLSIHGYRRPTSPNLDALLARSARFDQARVVEPLTGPSMVSMVTSRYPHQHAASRNGLRMRPKMLSLGKILKSRGYATAAFVGNWTLRDQLSGLGEHFDEYHEVLTRKRWFGLFKGEATAEDLTDAALDWIEEHTEAPKRKPFLLWVHYVEPHAPYRLHEDLAAEIGLDRRSDYSDSDRYDTEVAFVDRAIGRLLRGLDGAGQRQDGTLIAFSSDHGESLGEHSYWGHGRHLYDVTLRIPMSFAWSGRVGARTVDTVASNLDIAPTVLGLMGLPQPEPFEGHDFSAVLLRQADPPAGRVTFHQAHKGATKGRSGEARQKGLLEIALVTAWHKETVRVKGGMRRLFDLRQDPYETTNEAPVGSTASPEASDWLSVVRRGLVEADLLPTTPLDEESLEKMRALGYVE